MEDVFVTGLDGLLETSGVLVPERDCGLGGVGAVGTLARLAGTCCEGSRGRSPIQCGQAKSEGPSRCGLP